MKHNNAATILSEAEKNVKPHLDALEAHRNYMSKAGTFTFWITKNVGTVGFFMLILVGIVSWFGWNTFAPQRLRFDHSPTFVEWALLSSILQLLLLPLILIGQKLESKEGHLRSEADLQINKEAEKENQAILRHLERQDKILNEILLLLQQNKAGN